MNMLRLVMLVSYLLFVGCSGNNQEQHGWTTPQPLATYARTAHISTPATNSNGDILVNYVSGNTLFLKIYNHQTGWGREYQVGDNIYPGRLSLNNAGQGIFAYCETTNNVISQKVIQYFPDSGWETPRTIRSGIPSNTSAWVAMAPNGDTMVIWYENDIINGNSFSSAYYHHGAGWSGPVRLSNPFADGDVFFAGIAIGNSGKFLALWTERNNVSHVSSCYKSTFDPVSGWSSAQLFLSGTGDRTIKISDMDDSGNVAILLYWTNGTDLVETYLGRIGINLPLELRPQPVEGTFLGVVPHTNSRGDILFAWNNGLFPNQDIRIIRYTPQNGWGDTMILQNGMVAGPSLRGDYIGLDDSGNFFISGLTDIGAKPQLTVVRHTHADGWGKPVKFTTAEQTIFNSSLVVSGNGKAALVWTVIEGTLTGSISTAYISFYK